MKQTIPSGVLTGHTSYDANETGLVSDYKVKPTAAIVVKCVGGHHWSLPGIIEDVSLEGRPCDCGELIYHTDFCPVCEHEFTHHYKNSKK